MLSNLELDNVQISISSIDLSDIRSYLHYKLGSIELIYLKVKPSASIIVLWTTLIKRRCEKLLLN